MISYLRSKFGEIHNIRGSNLSQKVIVIESDDWGSIRMPDKSTYHKLLGKGIRVDDCPYMKYDSLADDKDITSLFEVLDSVHDFNGNTPVLTANCVMANPDFDKIKKKRIY